jgi:hypothetical protein
MFNIWTFIRDPQNRAVLTWIGSGIVAVVGIAMKYFLSNSKEKSPTAPTVSASGGGVAVGRDIRGSSIHTGSETKR